MYKRLPHLSLLALCTLLAACVSGPFRTDDSYCRSGKQFDCQPNMLATLNAGSCREFDFAVIEFDDQGMLHSPARYPSKSPNGVDVILNQVRELSSPEQKLPLFLLTYIHGWNHNASYDTSSESEDRDITEFKKLLASAAEKYRDQYRVMGVYIAWDGRIAKGALNFLTFYDRKKAAQEIGYVGITSALSEIEAIVKNSENQKNKMISIGHSFGGAALFSATQSILAERYAGSRQGTSNGYVQGFGDLVILLNPAFESIRYTGLFETAQDGCRPYLENQPPRLVILSSEADDDVRHKFTWARSLSNWMQSHNNKRPLLMCGPDGPYDIEYNQYLGDIYGVGHDRPVVTHLLDTPEGMNNTYSVAMQDELFKPFYDIRFSDEKTLRSFSGNYGLNSFSGEEINSKSILVWKGTTMPHNPFMNIFTTRAIIKNHNDIWNNRVVAFFKAMIDDVSSR